MPAIRRLDRTNSAKVPLWAVTYQEEDTSYQTEGSAPPDVIVHYETRSGVTGTVRIPRANYTAENVAAEIEALARTHEEVAHLKGDG